MAYIGEFVSVKWFKIMNSVMSFVVSNKKIVMAVVNDASLHYAIHSELGILRWHT